MWFDVGIKRYTTKKAARKAQKELWFDVGIKRYTTLPSINGGSIGCGLM